MIDAVSEALKRLEVDVKVARENWNVNPYLAIIALNDLEEGAGYVNMFLGSDPEANALVKTLPIPDVHEIKNLLREAHIANGVDLSHFDSSCECEKHEGSNGLPNPYASAGLPPEVMAMVEKLAIALGASDVQVVLPDDFDPDKV